MLARQTSQFFVPIHGSDTHHCCYILLVRIEPPCPVHTQKDMDPGIILEICQPQDQLEKEGERVVLRFQG